VLLCCAGFIYTTNFCYLLLIILPEMLLFLPVMRPVKWWYLKFSFIRLSFNVASFYWLNCITGIPDIEYDAFNHQIIRPQKLSFRFTSNPIQRFSLKLSSVLKQMTSVIIINQFIWLHLSVFAHLYDWSSAVIAVQFACSLIKNCDFQCAATACILFTVYTALFHHKMVAKNRIVIWLN